MNWIGPISRNKTRKLVNSNIDILYIFTTNSLILLLTPIFFGRFSKSLDLQISFLVDNFKKISAFPVYALSFHEKNSDKIKAFGKLKVTLERGFVKHKLNSVWITGPKSFGCFRLTINITALLRPSIGRGSVEKGCSGKESKPFLWPKLTTAPAHALIVSHWPSWPG